MAFGKNKLLIGQTINLIPNIKAFHNSWKVAQSFRSRDEQKYMEDFIEQ